MLKESGLVKTVGVYVHFMVVSLSSKTHMNPNACGHSSMNSVRMNPDTHLYIDGSNRDPLGSRDCCCTGFTVLHFRMLPLLSVWAEGWYTSKPMATATSVRGRM